MQIKNFMMMKRNNIIYYLIFLLVIPGFFACRVGKDYQRPNLDLPGQFRAASF